MSNERKIPVWKVRFEREEVCFLKRDFKGEEWVLEHINENTEYDEEEVGALLEISETTLFALNPLN